jgi:hypothetical protein
LREPDRLRVEPEVPVKEYEDLFGNLSTRFVAPKGTIRLTSSAIVEDTGLPDPDCPGAREVPVGDLPPETLRYLMGSRFCEVDLLSPVALELFGEVPRGWPRVQAICDWVQSKVTFSYAQARSTRTATRPATSATSGCRRPRTRWTSARGSKPTWKADGGHSTPATTRPGSDASSSRPGWMRRTLPSRRHSGRRGSRTFMW